MAAVRPRQEAVAAAKLPLEEEAVTPRPAAVAVKLRSEASALLPWWWSSAPVAAQPQQPVGMDMDRGTDRAGTADTAEMVRMPDMAETADMAD